MSMTNPKKQIFEQFAELAKALGHAHRLELLEHVSQGERSVERLAQLTGLSIANASQHLQNLRRGGFVRSRRDGKHVLYRLGDGPILELSRPCGASPSGTAPRSAGSSGTTSGASTHWRPFPGRICSSAFRTEA